MSFLTEEKIAALRPAQEAMFTSPVQTQLVSSDELAPVPQTSQQEQVEARIKADTAPTIGCRRPAS